MRVEWLTTCYEVRPRDDGLSDIIGAGISGLSVPHFPARTQMCVAAGVVMDVGENIAVIATTVTAFDPDGNPVAELRAGGTVEVAGVATEMVTRHVHPYLVTFDAPHAGTYSITVALGTKVEASVSFDVLEDTTLR